MNRSAQTIEQKTLLAGAIARALAVFCVDEVVVFDDDRAHTSKHNDYDTDYEAPNTSPDNLLSGAPPPSKGYTAYSDPSHFLAHLLSYLETPPYLRKHLFPMHPNLRTAGLLPSLDMPHHLRANEWCDYREGIVVSTSTDQGSPDRNGPKRGKSHNNHGHTHYANDDRNPDRRGSIVDTGLSQKVVLPDISLPEHARVTVRFSQGAPDQAEPVHSSAPRSEAGYYWGYYVRRCRSLSDVFTECPFDGGYDLSFGTSERGAPVSHVLDEDPHSLPDYKHLLVVFGGVAGIEAAIRNDHQLQQMSIQPSDAEKLFDYWVNLLPGQGSRTIRTEEAVWLGLTSLRGLVESNQRKRML